MPTPVKRTRISKSPSSGGDAAFIRQLPPKAPEPSDRHFEKVFGSVKPPPEEARGEQAPPASAILTVSSPEIVRIEPAAAQVDQFLDECYFCRKRIPHNSDVFMYGLFGAFCSEVCRFKQIYKDKVAEQAVAKSARTAVAGMKSSVSGS